MGLPQSIEAIWSLAERISGANIVMPEISIAWFSWITIPIGLIMLLIIVWQVKRSKQPVEETLALKKDGQQDALRSDVIVPKRPSPELVIEIDNFTFGFGGGGYPPKRFDDDNALWLRLGVTFKMNQTMRIETLYLLLSGESIQPHDESGYYFYFEMPQWAKPDEVRTIQLVAFAKGTKWGSEEKEIRITFPPQ